MLPKLLDEIILSQMSDEVGLLPKTKKGVGLMSKMVTDEEQNLQQNTDRMNFGTHINMHCARDSFLVCEDGSTYINQ